MMRNQIVRRRACMALAAMSCMGLTGCGGGSLFGSATSGASSPSVGSRFSQLFGSNSQAVGTTAPAAPEDELTCPPVGIRSGASTLTIGTSQGSATGNDVRYQVSITRTARDCNLSGGQIRARVGIQGRIIVGPAGAPPSVDVPMRVALIQESVPPKTIFTSAYRTSVTIGPDGQNVDFSLVAEDIVYPPPQGDAGDSYIFYIGFDPSAVKPERPARPAKKPRQAAVR